MLENVFRPWILARLLPSLVAAILAAIAAETSIRVLSAKNASKTSEGALAIERRAELVATLFSVAGGATILGLAIDIVGAHRLRASVRGAMCAYGVLAESAWGFRSLAISVVASLACAVWVSLHRLDLRLRAPELSRAKFALVLVVAPFVVLDFAAATRFALDLDLRMVASCCSTGLEGARAIVSGAGGGARTTAFVVFAAASVGAIVLSLIVRRSPKSPLAVAPGLLALVAALASVPAVLGYVAPHAYESPAHLCPFCLLDADGGYLGWPLYAALFAGTALGLAALVSVVAMRRVQEKDAIAAVLRKTLLRTAIAWSFALALASYPVVHFAVVTGGASLFGA
jgi:hypothetical protein